MKQRKLKDLAEIANVSPATISYVLNNREGVSPEKREYIKKLLVENGYEISSKPQYESRKNIRFVKYVRHSKLVDGNPGFVTSIIDSIEKECRRQHYNLVMSTCNTKNLEETVNGINDDLCDGVLFLGTELTNDDLPTLYKITVPVVVVDNLLPMDDFACVTMDNRRAIYDAVCYLQELKHKKIGFITNSDPSGNCLERRNAYKEAVEKLGIGYEPAFVYAVEATSEGAYESMLKLIDDGRKFPTALISNNDSMTIGVFKAFSERGIRVPQDVSIVSFDNIPFAAMATPPLTTLKVSCTDMGIWAVRLLIDRINYPNTSVQKMLIGTQLIIRGSTTTFKTSNHTKFLI